MDILITIDYELFGNGSGDVKKHMVEPAERLMCLGERYKAPVTFFVEVEEYLAFERYSTELERQFGYNPADLIRQQLSEMIRRGHDIQLHIHPQWKDARFENGCWQLNENKTSIDCLFSNMTDAVRYINERKNVLDKIIGDVQPGRSVCAYRAGAFCAQPGKFLIDALAKNNILFDTSVVKKMHRKQGQGAIDYTITPGKGAWRIGKDVADEDVTGKVIELPIASRMQFRFQQITIGRMKAKFSSQVPKEKQIEMMKDLGVSKNPISLLNLLMQRFPTKYDLHNVEGRLLARWIKKYTSAPGSPFGKEVVVVIGHTKEHRDDKNVETLFRMLAKDSMCTITDFNKLKSYVS